MWGFPEDTLRILALGYLFPDSRPLVLTTLGCCSRAFSLLEMLTGFLSLPAPVPEQRLPRGPRCSHRRGWGVETVAFWPAHPLGSLGQWVLLGVRTPCCLEKPGCFLVSAAYLSGAIVVPREQHHDPLPVPKQAWGFVPGSSQVHYREVVHTRGCLDERSGRMKEHRERPSEGSKPSPHR